MKETIFKRGDMTFTNRWAKPKNMKMNDWLGTNTPRKWQSKKDELVSEFLARIIKDMEDGGARIWIYLKMEMGE